jgi:chromosome segregation ATPase
MSARMNLFGKILTFFNILLIAAVVLLAAPIIQDRQKKHAAIDKAKTQLAEKEANLPVRDAKRLQLLQDLERVEGRLVGELEKGNSAVKSLESEVAASTDVLSDSRSLVDQWSVSAKDLTSETESRAGEQQTLEQSISGLDAENGRLTGEIEGITAELKKVSESIAAMETKISGSFEKLFAAEVKLGPLEPKNAPTRRAPPLSPGNDGE